MQQETELMQFTELSVALRKRGIIRRSKQTLYNWAKDGLTAANGETVRLRCKRFNRDALSSIQYVREFLDQLPEGFG